MQLKQERWSKIKVHFTWAVVGRDKMKTHKVQQGFHSKQSEAPWVTIGTLFHLFTCLK